MIARCAPATGVSLPIVSRHPSSDVSLSPMLRPHHEIGLAAQMNW